MKHRITVATYNIHRSIGLDGRRDPERIVRVVQEMDADIVGLQEVDTFHTKKHGRSPLEELAKRSGYHVLTGPTMQKDYGHYGNALLTRWDTARSRPLDLSFNSREPRGAIDATLSVHDRPLVVIVTHLGLKAPERNCQTRTLLKGIQRDRNPNLILMGDINEWFPPGRRLRKIRTYFCTTPAPATYPSVFPVFPLDRICLGPGLIYASMAVHRSPLSRIASDHLPLKAVVGFKLGGITHSTLYP